ncbi:iron-sulfur cluster assembly scaffold protein [Priestia flexa]|jgi:nitrogen fixation protein NifU and related proteins|uniref:iron-sulfur cluster assembly scaffold protein n=1 Tax=Priestia flexa TaxID=86664 RepID=UPI001F3D7705|nr:iron-sulfur cluster assembly scaffold protein [Priestia flexa]UIR31937.1 iron-sulfur cluster assembly scaffold protein [Priestia flexa]UZW65342.1 iron-sulfur cluster assembly scaffold protein [Priestia flexa]
MASCSMFTEIASGRNLNEMNELDKEMKELIVVGKTVEDERLGEAVSLKNVHQLPARYNCALMPWQAFKKLIQNENR